MSKEVPSPPQMQKGDIIARHAKRNIGVDGVPFIFNLQSKTLRWGDEDIDPQDIISLASRLTSMLAASGDMPRGAQANYVGSHMSSLEIDNAARELKFKGVEAWLEDHFSNDVKLFEAKQILSEAKERINVL